MKTVGPALRPSNGESHRSRPTEGRGVLERGVKYTVYLSKVLPPQRRQLLPGVIRHTVSRQLRLRLRNGSVAHGQLQQLVIGVHAHDYHVAVAVFGDENGLLFGVAQVGNLRGIALMLS